MKKTIISLSVCSAIATSSFAIGQGTSSYNQYESGDLPRTGISTSVSSGSKVGMTKTIGPRGNEMKGMPGLIGGLAADYLQKKVVSKAKEKIAAQLAAKAAAKETSDNATAQAEEGAKTNCNGVGVGLACTTTTPGPVAGALKGAAKAAYTAAAKAADEIMEEAKLLFEADNTAFAVEAGIVGDLNKLKEKNYG